MSTRRDLPNRRYVVLKIVDEHKTADELLRGPDLRHFDSVAKTVRERYFGCDIRALFTSLPQERIQELMARAAATDTGKMRPRNLLNFYRIACDPDVPVERLVKELSALPHVETAYIEGRVTPAGCDFQVNADNDAFAARGRHILNTFPDPPNQYTYQGYLDQAPYGIDARYAWTVAGGDGYGTSLVAVQDGWLADHQDLQAHKVAALYGQNKYDSTLDLGDANHGTGVLSIACAVVNQAGMVGIAPNVSSVKMSSYYESPQQTTASDQLHYANAILAVDGKMPMGCVVLVPLQWDVPAQPPANFNGSVQHLPVEYDDATFAAIQILTAPLNGYVVVEAAGHGTTLYQDGVVGDTGSGGIDLNTVQRPSGELLFGPTHPDSRAIIVGAAFARARSELVPGLPGRTWVHERADKAYVGAWPNETLKWPTDNGCGSNYGDRVDCYAWGQKVLGAAPGGTIVDPPGDDSAQKKYTVGAGTSVASAIIAGAALCVQGVSKMWLHSPQTPEAMRDLFRKHGTPQGRVVPGHVGVMPDLHKVIQKVVPGVPECTFPPFNPPPPFTDWPIWTQPLHPPGWPDKTR